MEWSLLDTVEWVGGWNTLVGAPWLSDIDEDSTEAGRPSSKWHPLVWLTLGEVGVDVGISGCNVGMFCCRWSHYWLERSRAA